jgi:alpha-N-arabinofuranosidase
MTKRLIQLIAAGALAAGIQAAEFHVALSGRDANPGTEAAPFRTIQHAAGLAQPGDVITVHAGVYRERISPPRGGESDGKRIVYQAALGEKVEIKGSEVVTNWVKVQDEVWKATLPNSFFGPFNPYSDLIHGDWFDPKGRPHHTGAVYLNGEWLIEAAKLDDLLQPGPTPAPLWFGQVDQETTTIWAQFKGVDPNEQRVEINVRRTVFYPEKTGINYLTVRGFIMRDAATPWAPPTAEQIGLIGTHWSKGWIIESNVVSHSICSGIALGKYGDQWDNRAESAEGYVETIKRALTNGWDKETVGGHLVRDNDISHCEQTGIVGSLGAAFSTITGNTIHDIHVRQLFSGAEMAGIKFHGAIDVQISRNHIHHCCLGLWLDWMAQGARVSQNLFHDNLGSFDLFFEVDHGPILVDNNILLSPQSLLSHSQGVAFVHDLFGGAVSVCPFDARQTPFFKAHSTALAGFHDNPRGDDRYVNNLFAGPVDLSQYDDATLPVAMDGNVFLKGAKPSKHEAAPLVQPEFDPALKLVVASDSTCLEMKFDPGWKAGRTRQVVTTTLLGRAMIPNLPFEQPDGTPICINTDYFGQSRNESNPTPGPFENPGQGYLKLKVR